MPGPYGSKCTEYLQREIQAGRLVPGAFIKLNEISRRLGISKTPLRDAIIQTMVVLSWQRRVAQVDGGGS